MLAQRKIMKETTLGIVLQASLFCENKKYFIKEVWGEYIETALAPHFKNLTIAAPINTSKKTFKFQTYDFQLSNISIMELSINENYSLKINDFQDIINSLFLLYQLVKSYDLIWIFMPTYRGMVTSFFCRILKKPYITYLGVDWSELPSNTTLNAYLKYFMQKIIVKGSQFAIVAGEKLYNKFNSYKTPIFAAVPAIKLKKEDVYYRHDAFLNETIYCLYVGGLMYRKGVFYLIQAMREIIDQNFSIILNIAGIGEQESEIRKMVEDLGIRNNVNFLGYIPNGPELYQIYRYSDVFILPSLCEGFPKVLYESLAHGVPIITTPVGGIPYLMKHERNCLLIPVESSEDIAKAVIRLRNDEDLRKRLIRNGYETILKILENTTVSQVRELLKQYNLSKL
ncbi:MAG: hypothetical protein A2Y62_01875 [Candidatus Fischerbacteria bacterium RBG_13_37_8]|uniref:Glycosyl transferase family 1 domain-containing protein n=1 Tax=Candidatus Fischerbacteria bacterium RBG_13_37_8 TaxID=1817863 RepID=A0A1F5VF56_9BACT|nr:MAG: hypothetical protein A2Y62_01875 [Candidatus Fischerbacteria bacterium RBG_13_37_8]